MRTTSSIQFYCRRSKVGKRTNGLAPVEVSIIICGQRTYCTLPLKLAPDEFNKKRQPPYITEALEAWRRKINDYQTQMLRLGIRLTPASLKQAIQNDGFRHYLAQCGSRLDINTIAAALGDDPATAMRYYTRILPEDMVKRQIKLVMGQ